MLIVKKFKTLFFFYVKDNNIFPCLHNIYFPITYRNASVFCQSECACLHKTANMVVFFVKSNENTYPKGRALMQMYSVVPDENCLKKKSQYSSKARFGDMSMKSYLV